MSLGIVSVLYWIISEKLGVGDLRLYAIVQYAPILFFVVCCFLFRMDLIRQRYLFQSVFFYLMAKGCEIFDKNIFDLLHHALSGHTLKHLFAAASLITMRLHLKNKKENNQL